MKEITRNNCSRRYKHINILYVTQKRSIFNLHPTTKINKQLCTDTTSCNITVNSHNLCFLKTSFSCCCNILWMKEASWMNSGWRDPVEWRVERKTLPSMWFKMLWQSERGPLSGVLFTHHKPVYYIDIQTTQSTTVLCAPQPRSLFALNTSMLIGWFSDMTFQCSGLCARSFCLK